MCDSYEEMKLRATEKKFKFPYLYDGDNQKSALSYGPLATPHCFVFDKNRNLTYVGRVDSQEKPGTGKAEDLCNAIDEVLAGKTVTLPNTKVFGCSMKWYWKAEYTLELYKKWSQLPVNIEEIDVKGIKELIKNDSTGKLRLINVWATWCGSCKVEFKDKDKLTDLLKSKGIEILYISIDEDNRDNAWKNMIKYYNLHGYHLRANGKLSAELRLLQNPKGGFYIPWHILLDENGNIVKDPSAIAELEKGMK